MVKLVQFSNTVEDIVEVSPACCGKTVMSSYSKAKMSPFDKRNCEGENEYWGHYNEQKRS